MSDLDVAVAYLLQIWPRGENCEHESAKRAFEALKRMQDTVQGLQAFKALTHARLDAMGVPQFPDNVCRISARLAWVQEHLPDPESTTLTRLNDVLQEATACGLLDDLTGYCKSPDSINDVCDAVESMAQERPRA